MGITRFSEVPGGTVDSKMTICPSFINLAIFSEAFFTATDQQGIIQERQIWIDDILVQTSSYYYDWNTTQEENGAHTISCRAKDSTVWGTEDILVIVDNVEEPEPDITPPNVIITSPIEGTTVFGIVSITVDASDANGISSYTFYINDY